MTDTVRMTEATRTRCTADIESDLVLALEATIPRYLRSLRQAVEQSEGPDRLTMQQIRCLQALGAEDGTALTTGLARRLSVAVPTMTRMLDGLAERGLIERQPDPSSRRQVRILLTEDGRALLARHEAIIAARLRRLLKHLDQEQQARLLRAVRDVAAALDADAGAEHDEGSQP
jgi:DNA-binding MarR family transcriptional regulator